MIDHIIRSDPAVNLSTSYGEALPWTNGSVQAMETLKQVLEPGRDYIYMTSIPCDGRPGPGSDSSTWGGCPQRTGRVRIMSDGGAKQPRIMYDGGPGMQSHHTHRNFLFGMVHLPPSGGTRWVTI
ncbi:hypothetical protein B0H17DRAFT_1144407 [Mycena rosella]|uniref:Uncharacterized protein n=1 Tax=Mycena rosella TaxID=1033263 RepID=A0AAD7CTI6_MYCRO|nr:hypothetical protein B0H17DRAFT_1144407 [Mycena rosella]